MEYPLHVVCGVDLYRKFVYKRDGVAQSLAGKEIKGAIKALKANGSLGELQLDLTPYLNSLEGTEGTGVFELNLPGSATRSVTAEGRYDVFISDVGTVDVFARKPLSGPVTFEPAVTDA